METEIMPNRVFLIGAAKCGTTTVDQMLRQHDEIFMSPIKEPNFYSVDIQIEDFTDQYKKDTLIDLDAYFKNDPLPPVHLTWVRKGSEYEALYRGATNEKYLGESSTSYLYSEVAAQKVYEDYPEAKIILCLRNPVDRLKSHLKMALQQGYISEVSDELIEADQQKAAQGWGISELFLELGCYGEQLERWYKWFPKEQIHIIQFEDIQMNQQKVRDELCAFLNVSIFALETNLAENQGGIPKYPKLNAVLRGSKGVKFLVDQIPESVKNKLKSGWQSADQGIRIDEDRWRAYYLSDIERLEKLTGDSYSQWKN